MAFLIKYRCFLSCTVTEKSSGEALHGLTFFPSAECRKRMEAYKLVFRPRSAGFEMFFSETPFIEITERLRFTFGFIISETGFLKKYGLTGDDATDTAYQPGLYFDNLYDNANPQENPPVIEEPSVIKDTNAPLTATGSHATAADTYHIYPPTFKIFDEKGAVPSAYSLVYRLNESPKKSFQVQQDSDQDYIVTTINPPDRQGRYLDQSGPYILKSDTGPVPDRRVYLDEELGRKPVRGIVDIYWEDSQKDVPDPKGQTYNITFKTKEV